MGATQPLLAETAAALRVDWKTERQAQPQA